MGAVYAFFTFCLILVSGSFVSSFLFLSTPREGKRSNAVSSSTIPMASMTSTDSWKVVPSIQHIVDDYDVFLLDMWGVMHDGNQAYDGVLDVVKRLQDNKKELIIVSNSSKRRENSVKMLTKLGFDPTTFSKIITSGEVAYQLLTYLSSSSSSPKDSEAESSSSSSWVPSSIPKPLQDLKEASTSRKVFCFGSGDGDREYLESCGWTLADSIATADLIVARGTFVVQDANSIVNKNTDGEEAYFEAYHQALQAAAQKSIPMMVCNPDKIRPDADKSPMPGTIGVTYEELLKQKNDTTKQSDLVLYLGKPFADVYEIALQDYPGKRACMVGDALETDVTGAQAVGIDSIWVVKNGVHNDDVAAKASTSNDELEVLESGCRQVVKEFNRRSEETYAKGQQLTPTIVIPYFSW
jgi:ribonucleotide monophosphatase NagD (HAD superfamily)